MKKTTFTLAMVAMLVLAFSINANAQKPTFGLQAGATFSKWTGKDAGDKESTDSRTGFTAGFLANFDISKNFAIQPSLNFSQKGGKESEDDASTDFVVNYLELPVNFLYKTTDAGKGHFFVGGGPYLGFAMSAKLKYDIPGVGSDEEDLEIGSGDENDLKPFDFGVNLMAGYQLSNGLFLSANFSPGLVNIVPGLDDESTVKNSSFGIRLGYMFGGKISRLLNASCEPGATLTFGHFALSHFSLPLTQ